MKSTILDDLNATPWLLIHKYYPSDVVRYATLKEAKAARLQKYGYDNYTIVKVEYLKEAKL